MPGPFHGYLVAQRGDYVTELINHARTAAYLMNPALALPGVDICSILDFGGCPNYTWLPYDTDDVTGDPIIGLCGDGAFLSFDHPATDPAPWYNVNYPESAEAIGFNIEEWTGLGSGHVSRATTERGGYRGGTALSSPSATGRVMKLNVILLARTEEGMQYLFDWLSTQLIGCSSCATDTIWFRRFCGSELDPRNGLAEMRYVGLTEGLAWESDIEAIRGKCFIRRASFSLTAGDPSVYLAETGGTVTPGAIANLDVCFEAPTVATNRTICRPECIELPAECRSVVTVTSDPLGFAAPVVHLYSGDPSNAFAMPVRVIVYADPHGDGTAPTTSEAFCAMPRVAEIYVKPLPYGSDLIWDVNGRRILYRDQATGVFVETSAFIDANDPPIPRFAPLTCGVAHVTIEPATYCLEGDAVAGWHWPESDITFSDPDLPEITVELSERVGAP